MELKSKSETHETWIAAAKTAYLSSFSAQFSKGIMQIRQWHECTYKIGDEHNLQAVIPHLTGHF